MPDLSALDLVQIIPFVFVGFAAQLVDGALGMAFGVISNTLGNPREMQVALKFYY